jgi:hypothetical protein
MMNWTAKGLRQNKANSRVRPDLGRGGKATGGAALGSIVQNKANLPGTVRRGASRQSHRRSCLGTNRAKQSQFRGEYEEAQPL